MTNKEIYLIVVSNVHQEYASMDILAITTKDTDAQKMYSKALKHFKVTTKHDGTYSNEFCIGVYRATTGEFSENIIRESEKLYTSEGC